MTRPRRIPVGEGTPEGSNGAYLLPDRGALVDPGPPGDGAWAALRDGIADADLVLSDIDHVFVTHWHVDHAGLACRLAEEAAATLHLHAADAPLVGDYAAARDRRLERDAARLREWGVPPSAVDSLVASDDPSPLPDTFPVRAHEDGDRAAGLELLHTPGHTAGHAAFLAGDDAFVGDAVLPAYTPNVGGSDTRLRDPLGDYLESLDRIDALGATLRPGHGASVGADRIETIREHHRERARRVLAAVDGGATTPWAVARRLFGSLSGVHVKFGAGEAAAHLARLASLGVLERVRDSPRDYRIRDGDGWDGSLR